jgi:phospholipase D1/2
LTLHPEIDRRVGRPQETPTVRPKEKLLRAGETMWRKAEADQVSFLVDADAFYSAFVDAALQAQTQIFIVGWDTDSRTELPLPENCPPQYLSPEKKFELGFFLAALTRERPELKVYVLTWDFAFIYLLERETWPSVRFSQFGADRLRFVLDREHPTMASHHQKIVVVDDVVAFSGGLDITQRRWDTPEHKGDDARRVDPGGHRYGPFHDVQICVTGEAAKALGDLTRERWRAATGDTVEPVTVASKKQIWPESARVDLAKVGVAISRTRPADDLGHGRVDEVERLFLESLAQVKRFAYIENQYFTCPRIARAIAERLKEKDGPEFIMVLPRDQTGWIEESTMGLLRSTALKIVRDADQFGRFRCYYPIVPGLHAGYVKVHSKVMVLDDEFVRVGSANLNNRSMGLDTECDLSIEASGRHDVREAARRLRLQLMGEHLGAAPDEVEAAHLQTGSWVKAVESLLGRPRTLIEMNAHIPDWVEQIAPPPDWIDPSAPKGIRRWFASRIQAHPILWGVPIGVAMLLALILLARLTIGESAFDAPGKLLAWFRSVDSAKISNWVDQIRSQSDGQRWVIPVVILGMAFASLVFIPITVMIFGLAISFGRYEALFISMTGSLLGAAITYGIGRYWAYSKSRILSAPWVRKASHELSRGGLLTMTAVRLAPIAPFTVVNIVSGVLRVPVRNFFLGTFFGLLPGICLITLISQSASESLRKGSWAENGMTLLSALAGVAVLILICRLFKKSPSGTSLT